MRIAVVHPAFRAVGGAEVLLARYARHLGERGHEVSIITLAYDDRTWDERVGEARVHRVPGKWSDRLVRPTGLRHLRRARRLRAALDGFDLVIAGNYPATVVLPGAPAGQRRIWWCMEPDRRLHPAATCRVLRARLDATSDQSDSVFLGIARRHIAARLQALECDAGRAERDADRAGVRAAHEIIAISAYSAESVRAAYGRELPGIVYPIVDGVAAASRTPGVHRDGLRVLVHTRLEWLKNVDTVLEAFARFRVAHPGAHELHVVGCGAESTRLEQRVTDLGLRRCTTLHGFVNRATLERISSHCDMMALLPVDEPFGIVFVEAAMRRLLIAGPDHGGPAEILDHGELGWNVDPFAPEPLAEAFAECWRMPTAAVEHRRDRLAHACRDRFGATSALRAATARLGA